jgi:hypothetical protein
MKQSKFKARQLQGRAKQIKRIKHEPQLEPGKTQAYSSQVHGTENPGSRRKGPLDIELALRNRNYHPINRAAQFDLLSLSGMHPAAQNQGILMLIWLLGIVTALCCGFFLVLWQAKRARERREREEYERYFKRLDDAK